MAIGYDDIQVILAIFIPITVIIIIPLIIYFHKNGVNYAIIREKLDHICIHIADSEKDKKLLTDLDKKYGVLENDFENLEGRVSRLESKHNTQNQHQQGGSPV